MPMDLSVVSLSHYCGTSERKAVESLCGVPVGSSVLFAVAYTDDVSIMVSCRSDIEMLLKALESYENVTSVF